MVSEQQKKILVIEDDEDIRTIVVTRLKRASCETIVAANGQDGLRRFYGDRPDLVVLDISMPVMDGWQVLERLREVSEVPVFFLTAASQERETSSAVLGLGLTTTSPSRFPARNCWPGLKWLSGGLVHPEKRLTTPGILT